MLDTEPEIIERYVRAGQVKLVYRHLQQLGPSSELLSEASECAADQGQFWEMRRALYARQGQLYNNTAAGIAQVAADEGLDAEQITSCLTAHTHQAAVQADFAAATAEGVRSRPVFRVGDTTLVGAQRFAVFQQLLDEALSN